MICQAGGRAGNQADAAIRPPARGGNKQPMQQSQLRLSLAGQVHQYKTGDGRTAGGKG